MHARTAVPRISKNQKPGCPAKRHDPLQCVLSPNAEKHQPVSINGSIPRHIHCRFAQIIIFHIANIRPYENTCPDLKQSRQGEEEIKLRGSRASRCRCVHVFAKNQEAGSAKGLPFLLQCQAPAQTRRHLTTKSLTKLQPLQKLNQSEGDPRPGHAHARPL